MLTELIVEDETVENLKGTLLHGVCDDCLAEAKDYIITACGILCDLNDYVPHSFKPKCVVCWSVEECKDCGLKFV